VRDSRIFDSDQLNGANIITHTVLRRQDTGRRTGTGHSNLAQLMAWLDDLLAEEG